MTEVPLSELGLGRLLAEGGEGRVFEVVSGAAAHGGRVVYKQLRRPRPRPGLTRLVAFPAALAGGDNGLSARVVSSSAWPRAVVVGDDRAMALGTLMPRAPAEFWLQHRDGAVRLASLSYLASDPDRITIAYGAEVPGPATPQRVGVVYALARLLDAWQARSPGPAVVHGDLSAKNVLWSVTPAPAVYVLDCDGATTGGQVLPGIVPEEQWRRATTPNWDDPAVPPGSPPTEGTDRYALGLIFLRVVAAAHFPLQGRQRAVPQLNVDLELPRSWRRLPDMPRLWALCERSLSLVNAHDRPRPWEWVVELEELLDVLGAADLAARVRSAQGDPSPGGRPPAASARSRPPVVPAPLVTVPDVVVRPVLRHRAPSTWQLITAGSSLGAARNEGLAGANARGYGRTSALTPRQVMGRVLAAWGGTHRLATRLVRSPGRRAHGLRRLAGVVVLDLAAACVALFLVGMVVSPWIGL